MPAWVKKSLQKKSYKIVNPTTTTFETDPAFVKEIAAADQKRGYLNVEKLDTNITLKVFRHEGGRPDLMRQLDASGAPHLSITAAGIYEISWTSPSGAAQKCSFEATISAGSGELIVELDDVYRVSGG